MSRAYSRKTGHACDFSEKGQKRGKKGKISASLGKNVQHLIYMLLYIHIYIYIYVIDIIYRGRYPEILTR